MRPPARPVRWGVADARACLESARDARGVVYLAVREAEALVRMPRGEVGAALTAAAARAETAAQRSLANGARLLDESPSPARLRLVQALPPGSTVELTSGS